MILNSPHWNDGASCRLNVSGASAILFANLITSIFNAEKDVVNTPVYPDDVRALRKEYDFIVVGAGSAGAAVAGRLSEVAEWNVLLIEAGEDPPAESEIPLLYGALKDPAYSWQYQTEPHEGMCEGLVNKSCVWPRGRMLGGTSGINAMLYVRANKRDYDNWAAAGNTGWSYEDVLPFFKKSEDMTDTSIPENSPYHARDGPLTIERFNYENPIAKDTIKAAEELGYPENIDFNGESMVGFGELHSTTRNGRRCSTAKAFLAPDNRRPNLHVAKLSQVTKILIDPKSKNVTGVSFTRKGKREQSVRVSKEVVVSGGTVNSPQLLMLSGIGPKEHLQEIGVSPIIADLKVGENLQDHALFPATVIGLDKSTAKELTESFYNDEMYRFLTRGEGIYTTAGFLSIGGFIHTNVSSEEIPYDFPDMQYIFFGFSFNATDDATKGSHSFGFNEELTESMVEIVKEMDVLVPTPTLLRPKSRGKILLKSKNPLDYPRILPGYFTDPEDMDKMIAAIEFTTRFVNTSVFSAREAELKQVNIKACKEFRFNTRDYWTCAVRQVGSSCYHPVGTCKMGPSTDPDAVVDPELRVYGVQGLRVADASIMPNIVSGNTNAPSIMIGEKAAHLIKKHYGR